MRDFLADHVCGVCRTEFDHLLAELDRVFHWGNVDAVDRALHHAASRGDNELVKFLVEKGADVTVVSRKGQTTADMANGPIQRLSPFPATIDLLVGYGAINNNNCVSC